MKRRKLYLIVSLGLVVAACDQTTAPAGDVIDEVAVARFAELVSEDTDIRMPHLGALLRAAHEAIRASDDNTEAVAHFRRARRLRNASEEAHEAGNEEEARRLAHRSYTHRLMGIVAALGPEAVAEAVAGSVAGLARLEAHLEGKDVLTRVTQAVERIGAHVGMAQDKLAVGELVPALAHALAAAEGIRHLSPRYVARKWIQQATSLLEEAHQAIGDAVPTDEEALALHRARRLLNVAKDELQAGHPARATEAAKRSAHLSWGVIQAHSSG